MSEFKANMRDPTEIKTTFEDGDDIGATFRNAQNGVSASMHDPVNLRASFGSEKPFRANLGSLNVIHDSSVVSDTTAGWDSQKLLISVKNVIYVYTDRQTIDDGQGNVKNVPGLKIGDGKAYLIDLPFVDGVTVDHMADASIHVTPEEKAFWNNKVTAYTTGANGENLVLTKL